MSIPSIHTFSISQEPLFEKISKIKEVRLYKRSSYSHSEVSLKYKESKQTINELIFQMSSA